MILQALKKFADDNQDILPADGLQMQEIKFAIEIDAEGSFIQLCDYRDGKRGKDFLFPKAIGRSGAAAWQVTFLLWDHYGYVLGQPKDDTKSALEMAQRQHATFLKMLAELPPEMKEKKEIKAIRNFYKKGETGKVAEDPKWPDCKKLPGCNLAFKLQGDAQLVPEKHYVHEYAERIEQNSEEADSEEEDTGAENYEAICLITGERGAIKKIHTATPIPNSKSNAKLLGFQVNSGYDSYGKTKAFNAPVSYKAEAAYTKALKYLLKSDKHSMRMADLTLLFWAEAVEETDSIDFEGDFPMYFCDPPKDTPDKNIIAIRKLYSAINSGVLPNNPGNRFFVLGLSPNAARITVRFWRQGTIENFAQHIVRHFDDFEMVRSPKDEEFLPLTRILRATAFEYKLDNVPPNLLPAMVQSAMDGTLYPLTLLQLCVRRIRAERQVGHVRAAICKAVLNREQRLRNYTTEKEIHVALDKDNNNTGYVLGRLFAVLERCQELAQGNLNASIRERFYGAFSSTPVTVLPTLLKLNKHHLAKLNPGNKIWFDRLMGEVMGKINPETIPNNLRLKDQARFAVGYYHQRQDFFAGKAEETESITY